MTNSLKLRFGICRTHLHTIIAAVRTMRRKIFGYFATTHYLCTMKTKQKKIIKGVLKNTCERISNFLGLRYYYGIDHLKYQMERWPCRGTVDFPKIYTMGRTISPERWRVHGEDVQVKAIRGNNGNFNFSDPNIYRVLIPTIFGGTWLYNDIVNSLNKDVKYER